MWLPRTSTQTRLLLLTLISGLSQSCSATVSSTKFNPIVDLEYAQYQGYWNATSNMTSFLGVRYAAPPTATLRFAAPQAPSPTPGVQQATTQPNYCYQAIVGLSPTNPYLPNSKTKRDTTTIMNSEDCLFLNVYSPGTNLNQSIPVVVWIHGGGYIGGEAAWYDGSDLVNDAHGGIVAVVIQYRLGLFGFLPGTAVYKNGALNAGLLDQNFALEWVQKNIHKFGGDPTKVAIWGESAGAGSVLQHAVAHGGNTQPPLFRAALTSSTFLPSQYYYNATIPEELYSEVVSQANCSMTTDTLSCLRDLNVTALAAINTNIDNAGFYGTYLWVPVIDGSFIVESPTVTLRSGRHNGEALLSITNSQEGYIFVDQTDSNLTNYVTELFPDMTVKQTEKAVELYSSIPTTVAEQCDLVMGESIFVCPTYLLLRAFGETGYKGEFAIPPAYHGNDLPYYFAVNSPYNEVITFNNTAFITAFSESFASMIMFLDPNVKFDPTNITPKWAPWVESRMEMLFNQTENTNLPVIHTIPTNSTMLERCAFWESIHSAIGQ